MAINYPLTLPAAPGFRSIQWSPRSIAGMNVSPFTGAQQVYQWPGEWLECSVTLPAMKDASAGAWRAFFLALRSRAGTFYLGDSVRRTTLGTVTGTVTVGSGAVANTTTLPLGNASGQPFALGDWLQVGTGSSARLHQVTQINSATSVEVFPCLRSAYASGTAVDYTSPVGLFRLAAPVPWAFDSRKICDGFTFAAVEVVP